MEADRGHGEEIDGDKLRGMIFEEGAPSLRWRFVAAHPKDGRVVTRCAACFQTTAFHLDVAIAPGVSARTQLVSDLGKASVSACEGFDPDPMWLGPVDSSTFLSVICDLLWIFLEGNPDCGFPLIVLCAPASEVEMATLVRNIWRRPLYLVSTRHREIVAAAIAVALLGSEVCQRYDLRDRLPVPVSQVDAYPFLWAFRSCMREHLGDIPNRIMGWCSSLLSENW